MKVLEGKGIYISSQGNSFAKDGAQIVPLAQPLI